MISNELNGRKMDQIIFSFPNRKNDLSNEKNNSITIAFISMCMSCWHLLDVNNKGHCLLYRFSTGLE